MKNLDSILENQKMKNLIGKAEEDWKDVDYNLRRTVRTGIEVLDNVIYGFQDEMAGLIGPSGSRKTTLLTNIILYNALSKRVEHRIPQVYLTVEAGMRPERLRDMMLAMRATQWLELWKQKGILPDEIPPYLFTDFFKFHEPSNFQKRAIDNAARELAESEIYVLGSGSKGGVESLRNYREIFQAISDNVGYCVIYIDHLHAIYSGNDSEDYGHIIAVINELSNLMKKHELPIVVVGQVSLSSAKRNAFEARGGTAFREECSTYLSIKYIRSPSYKVRIKIEKSRKSDDLIEIEVPIEPNSGLVRGREGYILTSKDEQVLDESFAGNLFDNEDQMQLFN